MLNEEQKLLNKIHGLKGWKHKRPIEWCDLCNTAIISCSVCNGSTCNCHSCEKCKDDFDDFYKAKTRVQDYLTPEEKLVWQKGTQIKKLILESLNRSEYEIPWKTLKDNGELSGWEEGMFSEFLK